MAITTDRSHEHLREPVGEVTTRPPSRWQVRYRRRVAISDTLIVLLTLVVALAVQLHTGDENVAPSGDRDVLIDYPSVTVFLLVAWSLLLLAQGTRDVRILGTGTGEYKSVISSGLTLFAVAAVVAVFLKVDISRSYLLATLTIGTVLLTLSRMVHRAVVRHERRRGDMSYKVVLLGTYETASHVAAELLARPEAGYVVQAACLTRPVPATVLEGSSVPVAGGLDDLFDVLELHAADTVVVTGSDDLPSSRLREVGWSLEPGRHHLVVAPGLSGVGGPRIHTRPVSGLPLIHVETPRFDGGRWIVKRAFDIVVASLLLLVLALPLLVTAALVRLTSSGPALYGQKRIGVNGTPFTMWKFRSMVVGADDKLAELLKAQGKGEVPLFKVTDDPRVTPLGRFLRRYSIDEFPQLLNVLDGSMSLVGPRPQRPAEVALYDSAAKRRLLLKPGMGGLWQVSGRSNLSWEDAIKLDLYYVENWSMVGDLAILARTARQVVMPEGAE